MRALNKYLTGISLRYKNLRYRDKSRYDSHDTPDREKAAACDMQIGAVEFTRIY